MFREFLHIWKKENLSAEAYEKAVEMLTLDQEMFNQVLGAFRNGDNAELVGDIYKTDKQINKSERAIRKKVLTHLIVSSNCDVPSGLVLASIVIDFERIGDYIKNIADMVKLRDTKLQVGRLEEELGSIEKRVNDYFRWTIQAFPESDKEAARKVVGQYKQLSGDCQEMTCALVAGDTDLDVSDAVTLVLYLRFLKRIAAHLYNICTSIVNPFHRIGYKEKPAKE